jgi:hypothetical protein
VVLCVWQTELCQILTRVLHANGKVGERPSWGACLFEKWGFLRSNTFGRIPVDQTIEETANKDTQTAGGTKRFSLKSAAVSRYYLTAEFRSICLWNIRELIQIHPHSIAHADLEPGKIKTDEKAVQLLVDYLENTWINPFLHPKQLVSISTAAVPPPDIRNDLFDAFEKGDEAYKTFIKTRQESDNPSQGFYDRLPKNTVKNLQRCQKV